MASSRWLLAVVGGIPAPCVWAERPKGLGGTCGLDGAGTGPHGRTGGAQVGAGEVLVPAL